MTPKPAPVSARPLRILMYARSLRREGGTEISSVQIARALSDRGNSVNLLYEREGQLLTEYLSFCRSVTRVHIAVERFSLRDGTRIVPAIWSGVRCRPDVIYVHTFRDVICGRLTGALTHAPVVCHLRDMFHDTATHRLRSWADRYIAVSAATRDSWVSDGIDKTRVDVVHTGIDPMMYPAGGQVERLEARKVLGLRSDAFVALYYGRLDVDKGIDVLFDAWRLLGMSADEGRLVLQGRPVLARDRVGSTSSGVLCRRITRDSDRTIREVVTRLVSQIDSRPSSTGSDENHNLPSHARSTRAPTFSLQGMAESVENILRTVMSNRAPRFPRVRSEATAR